MVQGKRRRTETIIMILRYPLDKIKITQNFGERPEVYKPLHGHNGMDFRTKWEDSPEGQRPVYAAANGIVEVGDQGAKGYGKFVRIYHLDGSETIYGHLSEHLVRDKQSVFVGKRIGISGNTGFSNAPHLHFGYRPPRFKENNGYGGYINPRSSISNYMTTPYFEQKIGQSTICVVDLENKKNIPFEGGEVFKLLYGDYSWVEINKVGEWSNPISEELIRKQ
jgi:murein DD-endopeptidase MepM/ murein hydrolase activator NlpD